MSIGMNASPGPGFPRTRMRRLRATPALRRMAAETALEARQLILPVFVKEGPSGREEISSLPGQYRLSGEVLVEEVGKAHALGVPAVILFGITQFKDESGSSAFTEEGVVPKAIRTLKKQFPELVLISDICLCEYTSHGHCGVWRNGKVDNDATLPLLSRMAVAHAKAGADIVAPSDMMDGRVAALREGLDREGLPQVPIMSYAVKYASGYYGPFREALGSTPQEGDRRGYQMDPRNAREALREADLDGEEGADFLLVKPALPYLDILWRIRERWPGPLVAYQVSGEYAMLKAAVAQGWLHEKQTALESLLSIRRAGADLIITYYAREAAAWLREG